MPEINYQLLRYQSDNIPHFDGNIKLLNRFISSVENLLKAFQDRTNINATINICLFDTILGKLTGRAAELIVSRTELNSWALIKDVLIHSFSDQRSIDCLIQDLLNLKPFKNENPIIFGMRVQDSRSLLFSKLNASSDDAATKLIKIKHYDEFALKTFLNGLPYNLQLVTRLKNPTSLEQAMSCVREEENFIQFRNSQNQNQNGRQPFFQNKNSNPNTTPQRPTYSQNKNYTPYRPNYNQFLNYVPQNNNFPRPFSSFSQPSFSQPSFSQPNNVFSQQRPNFTQPNFQRPQFSNQLRSPFNNQTRPSFNNRNFGQMSQRTNLNRNSRVEPMDTSSGNTILNNALQNKKFTTQELYNQEVLQKTSEKSDQTNNDFFPENFYNENPEPDFNNEYFTEYDENNYTEPDQSYDYDLPLSYSVNPDFPQNIDPENTNFTQTSQKTDLT